MENHLYTVDSDFKYRTNQTKINLNLYLSFQTQKLIMNDFTALNYLRILQKIK